MPSISYPYRSSPMPEGRKTEAYCRLRRALGPGKDPAIDLIPFDTHSHSMAIVRCATELVTEWYAPYLLQEIRQANSYEDAWPAAILLAFSGKPFCIDRLGELMSGSRPLEVLVSVETLADAVALSPPGQARDLAVYHLESSPLQIAKAELVEALKFSQYPKREPVPMVPLVVSSFPAYQMFVLLPAIRAVSSPQNETDEQQHDGGAEAARDRR